MPKKVRLVSAPIKSDAKFIVSTAELVKLREARNRAMFALEPKPGYKPASREIMAAALRICVDAINNLDLENYNE